MKYCPYCGADLIDSAASFCAECGKSIAVSVETTETKPVEQNPPKEGKRNPKPKSKAKDPKKGQKKRQEVREKEPPRNDSDYDGYYDDVVPADHGKIRESLDPALIKRIAAVAGIMLLIIGLCVLAMYLL